MNVMKYKVKFFDVFAELIWDNPEIELLDVNELIIWVPDNLSVKVENMKDVTKYEETNLQNPEASSTIQNQ